jgi:hypothetical protein
VRDVLADDGHVFHYAVLSLRSFLDNMIAVPVAGPSGPSFQRARQARHRAEVLNLSPVVTSCDFPHF